MILKILTLAGLALCVLGDDKHVAISEQKMVKHFKSVADHDDDKSGEKHGLHEVYANSYPSYEFSYKVEDPHTHDFKGQQESRDGDEVKGEYWLVEPGGIKRTVKYHSDKHKGFKAIVERVQLHKPKKHESISEEHIKVHHPSKEHYKPDHHEHKIVVHEDTDHTDHTDEEQKKEDDHRDYVHKDEDHKDKDEHIHDHKDEDDLKDKDDHKHEDVHRDEDDYKDKDIHKLKSFHKSRKIQRPSHIPILNQHKPQLHAPLHKPIVHHNVHNYHYPQSHSSFRKIHEKESSDESNESHE